MKQYQRSVARFIDYLDEVGIAPHGAEEWDDMLVEYKNARALTKGQFASTISGVEFSSLATSPSHGPKRFQMQWQFKLTWNTQCRCFQMQLT